jgi:hypothetical protein
VVTLNPHILAALRAIPLGGGYDWNTKAPPRHDGSARSVVAQGVPLLRAGGSTYCCGLTLDVLTRAWDATEWPTLDAVALLAIKRSWFVAGADRTGPVAALVPRGLAVEVRLEDAQAGDLAQLWRRNGSGHSVIVLAVEGRRLTYWSTQASTGGVGERNETIHEIHVARAIRSGGVCEA